VPHLEIVEIARLDIPQMDVLDPSGRRAAAQAFEELLNRRFVALDMHVDAPIGAVADPAGDPELARLLARPGAEEDALHPPGHANVASDRSHQTVELSGASSAF